LKEITLVVKSGNLPNPLARPKTNFQATAGVVCFW